MASHCDEVIVDSRAFDAKRFLPQSGYCLLQFIARPYMRRIQVRSGVAAKRPQSGMCASIAVYQMNLRRLKSSLTVDRNRFGRHWKSQLIVLALKGISGQRNPAPLFIGMKSRPVDWHSFKPELAQGHE